MEQRLHEKTCINFPFISINFLFRLCCQMIEAGVSSSLMGSTVEISPDFYLGFKPNEIIALAK